MTHNVLILCTHNSARSVLAECMLNALAERQGVDVHGFSAGSAPSGRVHPLALQVLGAAGVPTHAVRSKSWSEFSAPSAPPVHVVITVCDSAAMEACPYWPGSPVQVHWGYPDPSRALGDDTAQLQAFELTRQALSYRLLLLLGVLQSPVAQGPADGLRAALQRIAGQ